MFIPQQLFPLILVVLFVFVGLFAWALLAGGRRLEQKRSREILCRFAELANDPYYTEFVVVASDYVMARTVYGEWVRITEPSEFARRRESLGNVPAAVIDVA